MTSEPDWTGHRDVHHLDEDAADRLLVATARRLQLSSVTPDQKLLAYARTGHVQAISC